MENGKFVDINGYDPPWLDSQFRLRDLVNIRDANSAKIFGDKLAGIFNHYIEKPDDQPQAKGIWTKLGLLVKDQENDNTDEIDFLIRYLFLDSFGCSVPSFIEFKCSFKKNGNKREFEYIFVGLNKHAKKIIDSDSKEVQSGW